jgi:hypothetical protein
LPKAVRSSVVAKGTIVVLPYLLAFSRIALGLLFAYSFVTKARDMTPFAGTIGRFDLLPRRWSKTVALLFLGGEAAVVVLVIAGGRFLPLAFGLAGLLLSLFTVAVLLALRRNIVTSCNCFGATDKPLTYYDVGRNAGFIACSLLGWWSATQTLLAAQYPGWLELALLSFLAAVFVIVWTQLNEIATLLANQE